MMHMKHKILEALTSIEKISTKFYHELEKVPGEVLSEIKL